MLASSNIPDDFCKCDILESTVSENSDTAIHGCVRNSQFI